MSKYDIREEIANLPAGLERTVLRILSFHQGRSNAVSRADLVIAVHQHGFKVRERAVRLQISQLRKAGYLIGSAAGDEGGYFLLTSAEEFDEFASQEYRAKIADMSETLRAMQQASDRIFGKPPPEHQASLF